MTKIIGFPEKKKEAKIGVIIQARMTSTRFPGKSMALLYGKPVIQWTIERAKMIRAAKDVKPLVVLAVPDMDESEPMLELANRFGIENFCGSEINVLERFYGAALFFNLDIIMRITGDCPFIDPKVCSEVVQLLQWRRLDYSSNVYPRRTYPRGLDCEAMTMDALEACYKLSNKKGDLEHVTLWLQRTAEIKRGCVEQKVDMSYKNWCVDYAHDIERLEKEIKDNTIALEVNNDN